MFNFFRKSSREKKYLKNWEIDIGTEFDVIYNSDSIQYVNEDARIAIYFSVLNVSGNLLTASEAFSNEPQIIQDAGKWQLKGAKKSVNQILICVISFEDQNDAPWARAFFASIKQKNKS
ncbi:hypothetical protein [Chitinophaga arvensicola]|uniref:Uncharacterized protein n=1 Tax=Chitinophaga arvensicola TaxID=29529 RepID=A0A1I0RHW0_9BACT|nr:hypothetical protein [Chitinophaga arvensicola]SEW40469.1 hypothetical protein SAMN04488122_2859 [Chitinophaga arvensicola]